MPRAIDTWVNVNMGSVERPEWLVRVAEDYFDRSAEIFKDISVEQLIDDMDRAGVEKCIVTTNAEDPDRRIMDFPQRHPDRFALSLSMDPRRGMPVLRALETMVRNEPVVLARITPFMINLPPDDRVYYPVYAKCIDLDLPIAINTGIPGPPMPGKCQDPMYLDEVCVFFPELKLVMAHGADPWWDVAIRLMIKYRNLYLQTSAYAPRYFPPQLIHFMNTRGQDKIMFASDHPVLSFERCIKEAEQLDLREGVLDKFLYANAQRLFFRAEAAAEAAVPVRNA
ncbi:MAG TPA: amidohydrolase family protein [Dehalococcoidia bacterium]|jgi:predicted TIM-barrel fold metal-dependent hydrolase|nr:amidohydrolase family protein [Dehalococcoidia bacterium]